MLAGCLRDFRNKPFPTRARIEYYNNVLTLLFHNGMTNNDQDYEMCFRAENVFLPKGGYFGVSAATGGLADDHDVLHILTSSLHSQQQQQQQQPNEDQAKLRQEYEEYQKKLEQQKADYRKEHPNEVKEPEVDDWFESDNQRELRQIFSGQSQMFDVLRELHKKMDEVVGRQERTLSLVSQGAGGQVQVPAAGGQQGTGQGQVYIDTIRRDEVNAVLNNQNQIVAAQREMRQFILEVKQRADQIINNQAKAPTAQVQAVGYDTQSIISEMRDGLNHVKQHSQLVLQRLNEKPDCPSGGGGVSVTVFLVTIVIHLVIILGYNIYR